MAFCRNCGNEVNGVKFCGKCGTPVEGNGVSAQSQPVNNVQPMYTGQPVNSLPRDGFGLASLVCGIVGITACCGVTSIPGIICSIISMNKIKKGEVDPSTKWMGTVGLVLSIVAIVLVILVVIWYLFVIYFALNDPSYYA